MYFNSPPNTTKGAPALQYIWDDTFVYAGKTGVYRPVSFADSQAIQFDDFGSTGNLGGGLNNEFVFDNINGYSSIGFHLEVPSGGTVNFEGTFDGTNWSAATLRQVGSDGYVTYAHQSNDYIGSISSLKEFRARTSIAGSGVGTIMGRASNQVNTLEGIEHGFAPHRVGFQIVHKDFSYTNNQTGAVVWTPESGRKFVVTDINYSVDGSNNSSVVFFDETNSSGNIVSQLRLVPPANLGSIVNQSFTIPYVSLSGNNRLKISTSGNPMVLGVVHGYEIHNGAP